MLGPTKKPAIEIFSPWIALVGSIVTIVLTILTIVLTIYNNNTKTKIDEAEARLKNTQAEVAAKETVREDKKEKVARYTWIRSLLPDLIDEKDEKKRNFTISLVKQLLEKNEAEDLFTSLQASSTKELQAVGKTGLNVIQNEQALELAQRISQINADTMEVRKKALLLSNYKSSEAIDIVARLYEEQRIDKLSPSGIINGLVFLAATDPRVWSTEQLLTVEKIPQRLATKNVGPEARSAIDALIAHLGQVRISTVA